MYAQWMFGFYGKMKENKVTSKELAHELSCSEQWVSMVLNGKRSPKGAEQRFNAALDKLIAAKEGT